MEITILGEVAGGTVAEADARGEDLWLPAVELARLTGWSLEQEGLCRGDVCVPVGPERTATLRDRERVNAAALWRQLGWPLLHDAAGETWLLGENAAERARRLESLEAPGFELPDLDGRLRSLAERRGKKVLLVTWASW